MKKCTKCNEANVEEAIFCNNCGARLELDKNEKGTNDTLSSEKQKTEEISDDMQSGDDKETTENNGINENKVSNKINEIMNNLKEVLEKLNFSKWYIIPSGLVAIIIIGFLISHLVISSNPVYRTLYGLNKFVSQNKYDLTMSLETNLDNSLDELTKEIDNKFKISIDKRKGTMAGAYETQYNNEKIIDFVLLAQEGVLYFDVPEVLEDDEYLYYELEDIASEESFDSIGKYIDMIDIKGLDTRIYADAIYEATESDLDKKFNEVTFELESDTIIDMMEEILETAEDDEKLASWIQKNGKKVFNEMIEDDFEWGYMDDDVWEEMLDIIDDKDFEDDFADGLEEMVDAFKQDKEYYEDEEFELTVTVTFDIFNRIKTVVIEPEAYDESFTLTIENGKGYRPVRKYSTRDGEDIEKMDIEDQYELVEDIVDYLDDYVKENDDLEDFFEDLAEDNYFIDQEELIKAMIEELMQEIFWTFM
ncbi:zinc ribbon domain-containing protein [Vallitalea okinawensis]|uniref:zinc ribbon domain-containing protein n=1 Tax=Vallitalea okinawensis TaxID=2078660 RepID=UPI000CFC6B7D|nr:zinc ribbon domain-containing protein [Vallitalea okinawensis]